MTENELNEKARAILDASGVFFADDVLITQHGKAPLLWSDLRAILRAFLGESAPATEAPPKGEAMLTDAQIAVRYLERKCFEASRNREFLVTLGAATASDIVEVFREVLNRQSATPVQAEAPRICVQCRRHVRDAGTFCRHPLALDLVTGVQGWEMCHDMRKAGRACGPEGKLYEPKDGGE